MRLLVDVHGLRWDEAWEITVATLSYTNHTLLPEALETWPVELFERCCRGICEIIYRINELASRARRSALPRRRRFSRLGVADRRDARAARVRMGHLAFIGSHRINGVSAMHSELMRETVFRDLNHLYPGRITNKTNGITFRRWLMLANPGLTDLVARDLRRRRAGRSDAAATAGGIRRRQRLPAGIPRRQASQQGGAGHG